MESVMHKVETRRELRRELKPMDEGVGGLEGMMRESTATIATGAYVGLSLA